MVLLWLGTYSCAFGQVIDSSSVADTLVKQVDSLGVSNDLKSKVHYSADDSIKFDVANEKVYLYGNAVITYEDIEMKAAYIEVDWSTRVLFASPVTDSTGKETGIPEFTQGEEKFVARTVRYNFDSKKGKISQVNTKQGEGYIHGETVKKIDETSFFIKKGLYTTCELPHPHYSISSEKLKVIQNNKVITGPAYLVIEDVPTPLAIPFGYFPTRKGRASGILIPAYGESGQLGFFFKDGGYYFGIGDVIDFALTGDIYTLGSWGAKLNSGYANRYRFNGNLAVTYSEIKTSEKELPDYALRKDFFVRWNHKQDPKARPNSIFSANVNAGSSGYYQNNISSANNYLTNNFTSSISWTKSWPGKPYSLSSSIGHSQNIITKEISMTIPNVHFGISKISPFKRKVSTGTEKWYEKIGVGYQADFQNTIQTIDSLLFKEESRKLFRNGLSHNIPINTSVKVLKHFTLSPSVNYYERWYLQTIRKNFNQELKTVETDTVNGFRAARDFIFSTSLNTRIYGMIQTSKGKIAAVRHVMSPTLSFSYRPDFSEKGYNVYKTYQIDSLGNIDKYSIYETGIFGGPPEGKYGVIGFNLDNNFEMKVRTSKDTSDNLKKIKIFESLALGFSYNLAVDSLNWSPVSISGRTTLFDKIDLNFSSNFDPYVSDANGNRINELEISENNRLMRLVNSNISVGFSLNNNTFKTSSKGTEEELSQINKNIQDYIDYTVPFNLSVNYVLSYFKSGSLDEEFTQTLNFNGDLSVTPKWKVTFNSGYDFRAKDLSYTSLGIFRDLHCWEMRVNWVPFGPQQNYFFQINVKSSILQDLKMTKKNDPYDR